MRHLLLFVLFSMSIAATQAQDKLKYKREYFEAFISIEEAATRFYMARPNEIEAERRLPLQFEKKYDGWYVVFPEENVSEANYKREKIWDAGSKKYLMSPAKGNNNDFNAKKAAKAFAHWDYYILPLYGYALFFEDIIKLLEPIKKDLNADELEALARAYHQASIVQLYSNYPTRSYSRYDTTLQVSDIRPEQLKKMEEYAWKSLQVYKELARRFPDHQTLLGNTKIKLGNEFMEYYYTFSVYKQPELAKKFLDSAQYQPNMIALSKNYLLSCPPNAILLSYGDNDTYPLWYLQQKLGIRPDVTVINRSLIAVGRYIYHTINQLPEGQRIKHSLDMKYYLLDNNNYMLVNSSNPKSAAENSLADFLTAYNKNSKDFAYKEGADYSEVPFHQFTLTSGTKSIECLLQMPYLTKDELFLLDMIVNNWANRPICLTTTGPTNYGIYKALEPYLEQRGIISVLTTNGSSGNQIMDYSLHDSLLYKVFQYPSFKIMKEATGEYLPDVYLLIYLHALSIYKKIESQSEEELLPYFDFLYKVFPIGKVPYGMQHLNMMNLHRSVNAKSAYIERHFNTYINELKQLKEKAALPNKEAFDKYESLSKVFDVEYEDLVRFLKIQGWEERITKLEKAFEK